MYEPILNTVLVMINDEDAKYGGGNDDAMLGKSYRKGTIIQFGDFVATDRYPIESVTDYIDRLTQLKGQDILWDEGSEAGTTFEFDGKLFGMIHWWNIRGVKVGDINTELDKAAAKK